MKLLQLQFLTDSYIIVKLLNLMKKVTDC